MIKSQNIELYLEHFNSWLNRAFEKIGEDKFVSIETGKVYTSRELSKHFIKSGFNL